MRQAICLEVAPVFEGATLACRRFCLGQVRSLDRLYALLSYGKLSFLNNAMPKETLYEGTDLETLSVLHRYRNWIVQSFQPELCGKTIEFGAGTGNIAQCLLPDAEHLDLVEPSPHLHAKLEERFSQTSNAVAHKETLENWISGSPSEVYDSVVLVNVLEHIEDDAEALAGFWRILKPGGHLFLLVPALPFLYSPLDALVGHYRRYRLKGLRSLVVKAGFSVIRGYYFDILGVFPWLLFNRILGYTEFKPGMVALYDRVFVPITRFLESVIKPPLGKNVIIVANKPFNESSKAGDALGEPGAAR